MRDIALSLADRTIVVQYPESLHHGVVTLFGKGTDRSSKSAESIIIQEAGGIPERYVLQPEGRDVLLGLDKASCLYALLGEAGHSLINHLQTGVALHAGAVSKKNRGIVFPGTSGSGKSSLTAWFIDNGYDYLTDEIVVFGSGAASFEAFSRPLVIKSGASAAINSLKALGAAPSIDVKGNRIILPPRARTQECQCYLMLFPRFDKNANLVLAPLTAAEAGLELMACNVNARNLKNHGFDIVSTIARKVPAIRLSYGHFKQLRGVLDTLTEFLLERGYGSETFNEVFHKRGPIHGVRIV